MVSANYSGLLEAMEERFAGRMKNLSEESAGVDPGADAPSEGANAGSERPLAIVSPARASEVELLAQMCARRSIPVVPEGAGTAGAVTPPGKHVAVRFDAMRRVWPPRGLDQSVTVEPGISWFELEEHLRGYGRGAPVYPTSALRATVGGWLASNGIGVGSYEFGWISENVLSASVVTPDGGRHEIAGAHLHHVLRSGGRAGVIVSATLRTRAAGVDTPFAANFDSCEQLTEALRKVHSQRLPLWHLGFHNAAMARSQASRANAVMFGAYPTERSSRVEESLNSIVFASRGVAATAAETYRFWGNRFFPVNPAREAPMPGRALLNVESLRPALFAIEARLGEVAILGSLAKGGEVLLRVFDFDGSRPLSLTGAKLDALLQVVGRFGGSTYLEGRSLESRPTAPDV